MKSGFAWVDLQTDRAPALRQSAIHLPTRKLITKPERRFCTGPELLMVNFSQFFSSRKKMDPQPVSIGLSVSSDPEVEEYVYMQMGLRRIVPMLLWNFCKRSFEITLSAVVAKDVGLEEVQIWTPFDFFV